MRLFLLFNFLLFANLASTQPSINIRFKIENRDQKPIAGARIAALNHPHIVTSSADGTAVLQSLPAGAWQFSIEARDYAASLVFMELTRDTLVAVTLDEEKSTLADVIVVSEKRDYPLLATAASVSTLSAGDLGNMRIWQMSDLSGLAPNVALNNPGDNRNVTGIRGITTTSYETAVATYVDGVAQFNLDSYLPQLHDVDRIEVLRGPQGTLYGRNAMGGVINIITKAPSNDLYASGQMHFGNYGQQRYSAIVKAPLVHNKLYAGASLLYDSRNGYFTNDVTNTKLDDQRQLMAGMHVRYLFGKNWSLLAQGKYYQGRNDGAFPLTYSIIDMLANPYHVAHNLSATMHDNTGNASLVASHKGRRVDLTFQTAWQKNYRYYGGTLDADFSPADAVGLYNNAGNNYNYSNAWTNEIRFSSSNQVKSHIEWTAGAYHFIQKSPTRQATVFGEDAGLIGAPDKNFAIITSNTAANNGLAAFGNATWHATGAFSITAGLRMDYEARQLTASSAYEKQPDQPVTLQADTTGKTNFQALSPRLGLQYKTSANSLLFLNYNRGFRSGGLSGISSDPSQVPLWAYKPEYGNMFELGFKAETHNKKLRFGAAAFYNAIRDVQAPQLVMPDAVVITTNAGKLNTGGFELEMEAKPVRGLHVRYAGGYTYSKFGSLTGVNNGSETDLSGNKQVFTPVHTQFVSAQYNKELGKATLSVRIDFRYFGKQYFDLANTISQDGYGLLNLRAAVGWGQFEIQVWSRNLTNTFYIGYAYDFGAARPGEPQVYGVGLGWQLH